MTKPMNKWRTYKWSSLFGLLAVFLLVVGWASTAWAVSVEITNLSLISGDYCGTATIRAATNASYNGIPLDLIIEITAEENDLSSGCVAVSNGVFQYNLKDKQAADNDAWAEFVVTVVKKDTTTPVAVDRLLATFTDLDSYGNSYVTDSDDVYLYLGGAKGQVFLAQGSVVTYHHPNTPYPAHGSLSLPAGAAGYDVWLEGKNTGDCSDDLGTPDPKCRAGGAFLFFDTSSLYFRLQNDNAYGTTNGPYRAFFFSLQAQHFEDIYTTYDHGDSPLGSPGNNDTLATTELVLGTGMPPDEEGSYPSEGDTDDDDDPSKPDYDDEDAVRVGGSPLEDAHLAPGSSYDLTVDTYVEPGGNGYLNGWFDWNGDGDFNDTNPDEHVINNQPVTTPGRSTYSATLSVPSSAQPGTTYARFILSESQVSDPINPGNAKGETEDYALTILSAVSGNKISGHIYEDVNGDGDLTDGQLRSGVAVDLYDAGGTLVAHTTTDANGAYNFGVSGDGEYYVVVDSKTVPPSSFNGTYSQGDVWAEQTYGAGGSWGGAECDLDGDPNTAPVVRSSPGVCFGGRHGDASDDASVLASAEHVARVNVNGADVTGVDFGFSFNVVTNTSDQDDDAGESRTAQGSLRQFIQNANAISGANAMRFVPAVPANQGAWWSVDVQSNNALPAITDGETVIDGTAYDLADGTSVRNANAGYYSRNCTTVGVDQVPFTPIPLPELEVVGNDTVNWVFKVDTIGSVSAANIAIRNLAVFGSGEANTTDPTRETTDSPPYNPATTGDVLVINAGDGLSIDHLLVGLRADGTVPSHKTRANGINFFGRDGGSASYWTVEHNAVAHTGHHGIYANGSGMEHGVVRQNDATHVNWLGRFNGDGISLEIGAKYVQVEENCVVDNNGPGIEAWHAGGNNTFTNNTIYRNGLNPDGNPYVNGSGAERFGVRLMRSDNLFEKNIVAENYGAGVVVTRNQRPNEDFSSTRNRITQNIFYDNGGIAIDLDQTHGDDWSDNPRGDGVTPNDGATSSDQQNEGVDYPIFTSATLNGNTLELKGYIGSNKDSKWLSGDFTLEIYKADNDTDDDGNADNDNDGAVEAGDGQSKPHGEGAEYLGSCTVTLGGNGTFTCTLSGVSSLGSGGEITATATDSNGNTSEFGPNKVINHPPTATDDSFTTPEDTQLTGVNVITDDNGNGADSDPDNDSLTVTALTWDTDGDGNPDPVTVGTATDVYDSNGTLAGQLTINSDGSLTFEPATDYNGTVDGITYTISDGNGGADTANVKIAVSSSADLSIDKQAQAGARAGETLTYTLVVSNAGPASATNATVTDPVPAGFLNPEYSLDGGTTWSAWSGSVNLGTLNNGASATVLLRGQVDPQFSGALENTAKVAGDNPDPDPTNNEDTVTTDVSPRPTVQILLSKTVEPLTARIGEALTYTLWVSNPSDVSVTFDLTDVPDPRLRYVPGSASPSEPVTGGGRLTWSGLQLAAHGSLKVTYRMRVLAGANGRLVNRAVVGAQEHDTYLVAEAEAKAIVEILDSMFADRKATIVGRVYFDTDRDGVFDPGRDRPLPGARVLLANGRQTVTDARGNYAFREAPPGVWMVVLDERSAPFEPLPNPEALNEGYEHRVSAWGLTVSDFPLAPPAGAIDAIRSTVVRYGPLTLTKTLIPLDKGRYRVVLHLVSERPVHDVTVVDPLPGGGERSFAIDALATEQTQTYELEGKPVLTDPELHWRGQ